MSKGTSPHGTERDRRASSSSSSSSLLLLSLSLYVILLFFFKLQISSSEYFSVSFECLEDPGAEEFVAASKGTSLRSVNPSLQARAEKQTNKTRSQTNQRREALAAVCERRGVDLSDVNVFLDTYKTPLSLLTTETFWLGGKHLRIAGTFFFCFWASVADGGGRPTAVAARRDGDQFAARSLAARDLIRAVRPMSARRIESIPLGASTSVDETRCIPNATMAGRLVPTANRVVHAPQPPMPTESSGCASARRLPFRGFDRWPPPPPPPPPPSNCTEPALRRVALVTSSPAQALIGR